MVVAEPELRRQRMVLFRQDSRRGRVVAAASPLAIRDGIRVSMPLSEAKSLLQRSVQQQTDSRFHIFEQDTAADLAALTDLADALGRFSPIVGLEQIEATAAKQGLQPVSILLDVTGLERLFGDETQLAQQIYAHVQQLDYLPRLALANTVGMAWGASRFAHQPWLVIPADDTQIFAQLPIETLRLAPATVTTLHRLGFEINAQLWQLSRADLAMRFGQEIHRRIDQALGQIAEPVIARQLPPEFQAEQLLDYPTHQRATIEVIIGRLITKICEQLRARQQGALQWTIRLIVPAAPPLEFTVSLFQPTATANHILPLVELQLEQIFSDFRRHSVQVQEIQVSVTAGVLLVEQQRQLFDENPRLDKQALAQLINRLTSRLGQHNVVYPQLQSGAQPEYSYRFRPLVDIYRQRSRQRTTARPQSHVAARPLKIFHPPVAIALRTAGVSSQNPTVAASTLSTGFVLEPTSTATANPSLRQPQTIVRSWGPERIETGWWRGQTVCRDYWRVETARGQQYWVYRDLREKLWFVQGEF